ncbi:hypothetical protein AXA44_44380 [Rhodococcus sp. SC4]|nr:hypothetical protein AXA44_44380 [Rhodococcus sp. SC4]
MSLQESSVGDHIGMPKHKTYTRRHAWLITAALVVLMMINWADKAVLGLAAKPLMTELGISSSQYGLISSCFFLVFCVSSALIGFVANRVQTTSLLLVMALLWSVTQIPIVLSATVGVLFASRILLGAAEGPAYPVMVHAVHKWFPDSDRNLPTSLITFGAPIGVVIAAPVLTWLIIDHGWRTAFVSLGIVGFVWALVWIRIGREGPSVSPSIEQREHIGSNPDAPTRNELQDERVPYLKIFLSGTWLASILAGFAIYWALTLLTTWVPLYLQDGLGYSASASGTLITLPWLVYAIALVAQGYITGRMMRRGVSSRTARGVLGGCCITLAGIAMLALLITPPGILQIVLLALAFGIGSPIVPISQTVTAELTPARQRAGVLGTAAAVFSLAGIIAPYFVGRIIDASNTPLDGYKTAFAMTAVVLIVAGIAATTLIRPQRDAQRIRACRDT